MDPLVSVKILENTHFLVMRVISSWDVAINFDVSRPDVP